MWLRKLISGNHVKGSIASLLKLKLWSIWYINIHIVLTSSNVLFLCLFFFFFFSLLCVCVCMCVCNSVWLACRLYGFVGGLSGTVSILTLTAISLDRYFVIIYPLNPTKMGSKKWRAITMICVVWTYSFTFSVLPALNIGLSKYTPEGFLTSCSFDYLDDRVSARIFMFIFFIGAWFIPLSTIIYCYAQIMKEVNAAGKIQSNRKRQRIEHKLTIVVINVIVLWFLAWTPYAIVALFGIFGKKEYLTPMASMIPGLFCKISACINPYLYSMTHPQFKKEILRFFYVKFGIGHSMPLSSTTKTLSVRFVSTRFTRRTSNMDVN